MYIWYTHVHTLYTSFIRLFTKQFYNVPVYITYILIVQTTNKHIRIYRYNKLPKCCIKYPKYLQ